MLFVIVNEADVRRRSHDHVEAGKFDSAGVVPNYFDLRSFSDFSKLPDPIDRVKSVAPKKLIGVGSWLTDSAVLITFIGFGLGFFRKVEVVVRCEPSGPSGSGENYFHQILVFIARN